MPDLSETDPRVQIDASYYPHIMDQILGLALPSSPLTLRKVCRYWRALVDVQEAHHVVLDMGLPPFEPEWPEVTEASEDAESDAGAAASVHDAQPDEDGDVPMPPSPPPPPMRLVRKPAQNVTYVWQFSAKRLPITYMHRTLAGTERRTLPWVDVRRNVRAIDIRSSAQWVRDAVPLDDFKLHTVRLSKGAGWDSVTMLPHAYRVVFANGPYARNLAAIPDNVQACTCERTHTRRVVLNVRNPVLDAIDERVPPTIPSGLRELVVIFHGWPVIPQYNPIDDADADGGLNGDPRNDARQFIVAAAAAGVRVTVVNVELLDLKKGIKTCNWESYQEELEEFCAMDVEEMGMDPEQVMQRVRFVSAEKYRKRVGEKEFRFEAMLDV
ncbi:hypothetical protein A1Q2_06811 [Trichosporon asahii var. asahii CBS 8904]|uniref:F-box domain-containing protein n=2 Tax=Trichosporon asahii var. asahii TaxID=189963 RepID=K1VDD8_TRIAC|nr:hypothetical protein A1Q1_00985 [Trichosporon asahii var. asahii CBS 2479]EJT49833.1 hypothetical protein A1Q1_00985 [Trichosporon asahii var. asahii CBS 2479]EKC98840.1 hypothetical protein A1Q2_06811 [Trichosporon asahii var. asahii CBS 8904]